MNARTGILILIITFVMGTSFVTGAADNGTICNGVRIVETVPATASAGEKVPVSFTVTNTGPASLQVSLEQKIPDSVDPDPAQAVRNEVVHAGTGYICYGPNCTSQTPVGGLSSVTIDTVSYRWTVTLNPGETKEVSSWIVPRETGEIWLDTPAVRAGQVSCTLPGKRVITGCSAGHLCDPQRGENYLTCPANCPNWSADAICNPVQDGQCDPDCRTGADPDCGTATPKPTASAPLLPVIAVYAVLIAGIIGFHAGKRG